MVTNLLYPGSQGNREYTHYPIIVICEGPH
jgi:hypothetical protein